MEVKIGVVEVRNSLQLIKIEDFHPPALELDEAEPAKLLEGPVDVDRCQAKALAKLDLRQWKFIAVAAGQSAYPEPDIHFAKQVRHARQGRPATQRQGP